MAGRGASNLSRDKFGDEGERYLPCAAKLDDIETGVFGLYNGWQRIALAERRDIAGCPYGAEHTG